MRAPKTNVCIIWIMPVNVSDMLRGAPAKFFIVGVTGFAVDATLLALFTHVLGWGPIVVRIPSYAAAVCVTYFLNRHYTFGATSVPHSRAFPAYITANIFSQSVNFLLYSAMVLWMPLMHTYPVLALAVASGCVMVLSYYLSKHVAFKKAE